MGLGNALVSLVCLTWTKNCRSLFRLKYGHLSGVYLSQITKLKYFSYLMVSSTKRGHENKHQMANRTRRYLAGAGEVEENLKAKMGVSVAAEREGGRIWQCRPNISNIKPAYYPIGDS